MYLELIKQLEDRVYSLEQKMINDSKENTPLWKIVLEQTDFFNGHGQMEINTLNLEQIEQLLEGLQENCESMNNIFYLQLFNEGKGEWGGSIYQSDGKGMGADKLWLGIEEVVI